MFLAIVSTNDLARALINRCAFEPENIIVCSDLSTIERDQRLKDVQYCNQQDYEHYTKQCLMKKPKLMVIEKFGDQDDKSIKLPRFYKQTRVVFLTNIYELPFISFNSAIHKQSSIKLKYDAISLNFEEQYVKDVIESPLVLETITSYNPSLKIINWLSSVNVYHKTGMEITFSWNSFG